MTQIPKHMNKDIWISSPSKNLITRPYDVRSTYTPETTTYDGINYVVKPDGKIIATGITERGTNYFFNRTKVLHAGSYTLSYTGIIDGLDLFVYDNTNRVTLARINSGTVKSIDFTVADDVSVSIYLNQGSASRTVNVNGYAMLEKRESLAIFGDPLPYEPAFKPLPDSLHQFDKGLSLYVNKNIPANSYCNFDTKAKTIMRTFTDRIVDIPDSIFNEDYEGDVLAHVMVPNTSGFSNLLDIFLPIKSIAERIGLGTVPPVRDIFLVKQLVKDGSFSKLYKTKYGEELITNGDLSTGDLTGWTTNISGSAIYSDEVYKGSHGSIKCPKVYAVATVHHVTNIPIDTDFTYEFSLDARSALGQGSVYAGIVPLDIDSRTMETPMYTWINNTLTELTQDLNDGDTVIHVTSLDNWNVTTGQSYQKGIIVWNYKDSTGYQYPPETYSRNVYVNLYTNNSNVNKTAKTITLDSPWNKGKLVSGTKLSQCNSGDTFVYIIARNKVLGATYEHCSGRTGGRRLDGNNDITRFPAGTAYVQYRIQPLFNRASIPDTEIQYFTNMSVKRVFNKQFALNNSAIFESSHGCNKVVAKDTTKNYVDLAYSLLERIDNPEEYATLAGHKFLILVKVKPKSTNTNVRFQIYLYANGSYISAKTYNGLSSDEWSLISSNILTLPVSGTTYDVKATLRYQINSPSSIATENYFYVKNFMCFDLTEMYGAGNEPANYDLFELDCRLHGINLNNYIENV